MNRKLTWVRIGLMVAVAVAAAVAANVALVGYASPRNDPVGRLTPQLAVETPATPTSTATPAKPAVTSQPKAAPPRTVTSTGTVEDHGGSSGGSGEGKGGGGGGHDSSDD